MSDCKPTSTSGYGPPLSNKQPEDTLLEEEETRRYEGIVGCFLYITQGLRYDVIYAAGPRPMSKPSKVHLVAAKYGLRYLVGTTDIHIASKKEGFKLAVSSCSNWANNPVNRKSTSCYLMMLANAPVSFKSNLQSLTAMSTM